MNYHDFEKYNGKKFDEFIVDGKIGDVNVVVDYDEGLPEADVRLADGTLIGHGTTNDYINYVFTASNTEWT